MRDVVEIVVEVIKHMPTQHDQQAHAGNFGKGGGNGEGEIKIGKAGKMKMDSRSILRNKSLPKNLRYVVYKQSLGDTGESRYIVSLTTEANLKNVGMYLDDPDRSVSIYVRLDSNDKVVETIFSGSARGKWRYESKDYKSYGAFENNVKEAMGVKFGDYMKLIRFAESR